MLWLIGLVIGRSGTLTTYPLEMIANHKLPGHQR